MNPNARVMVHVITKLVSVYAKVIGMDIHAPSRSVLGTLKHTRQIITNSPVWRPKPFPAPVSIRVAVRIVEIVINLPVNALASLHGVVKIVVWARVPRLVPVMAYVIFHRGKERKQSEYERRYHDIGQHQAAHVSTAGTGTALAEHEPFLPDFFLVICRIF